MERCTLALGESGNIHTAAALHTRAEGLGKGNGYPHFLSALTTGYVTFTGLGWWRWRATVDRLGGRRWKGRAATTQINNRRLRAARGSEFLQVFDSRLPIALPTQVESLLRVMQGAIKIRLLLEKVRHDPIAQMLALQVPSRYAVKDLLRIANVLLATLPRECPSGRQLHTEGIGVPNDFLNEEMEGIPVSRLNEEAGPHVLEAYGNESIFKRARESLRKDGQVTNHVDFAQARCNVFATRKREVVLA